MCRAVRSSPPAAPGLHRVSAMAQGGQVALRGGGILVGGSARWLPASAVALSLDGTVPGRMEERARRPFRNGDASGRSHQGLLPPRLCSSPGLPAFDAFASLCYNAGTPVTWLELDMGRHRRDKRAGRTKAVLDSDQQHGTCASEWMHIASDLNTWRSEVPEVDPSIGSRDHQG